MTVMNPARAGVVPFFALKYYNPPNYLFYHDSLIYPNSFALKHYLCARKKN